MRYLSSFLSDLDRSFKQKSSEIISSESISDAQAMTVGSNLAPRIAALVLVHRTLPSIQSISEFAQRLLSGESGVDRLLASCEEMMKSYGEHGRKMFEAWCRDTEQMISNGDLIPRDGRLMGFGNGSREMQVYYSDDLVALLRQLRQLTEMGYTLPNEISKILQPAERYFRHALKLKQVANFYNSLFVASVSTCSWILMHVF